MQRKVTIGNFDFDYKNVMQQAILQTVTKFNLKLINFRNKASAHPHVSFKYATASLAQVTKKYLTLFLKSVTSINYQMRRLCNDHAVIGRR